MHISPLQSSDIKIKLNCENIAYKQSSVFSISLKQNDVNSTSEAYLGPMMAFFLLKQFKQLLAALKHCLQSEHIISSTFEIFLTYHCNDWI